MNWINIAVSLGILSIVITAALLLLIRGGARREGLDQRFLDEEQAKAIREWNDNHS
ncbi:hypothetical protein [Pseudorhizobium flavum]|uniref:Uncharacterized protein n=1 Tax=Pseudorhizobium flavum TaxID=1335061 RepID=A0A7X0DFS2_9HYPH|nr:hypothetical protein [Pseudorhizobium flavum]MBB6182421.1 hypothetical protein [Pseudorhizobium flavum]CAD6599280.1 hypothetical protein RFYW14_00659 [Pseudorhizobium flavum]